MSTVINLQTDLIQRCARGDSSAQRELYSSYARQMFAVAVRLIKNKEDAEDVLQECFIAAFGALETFREDASFGSWLKRIVINKSLNHLKKKRMEFEELTNETSFIEEEVEIQENEITMEAIHKTLDVLPLGYRLVFSLYYFEDMSHKEIAGHLEISESTSKSQLNRAKKKLRSILTEGKL